MSWGDDALTVLVALLLCCTAIAGATPVSAGGGGAPSPAVDGADDRSVADRSERPSLELSQRTLGNIFLANETVRIGVETDAARVHWSVHDYQGRRVGNGTAAVDGERTLTLPVDGVGHYTLRVRTATTGSGAGLPAEARTTLAVLPADGFDTDDEFFGIAGQFSAGWDLELTSLLDYAGVGSVRDDSGWGLIEEERGEYDFGVSDPYMDALRDRGFERLYILAYGNTLYDSGGEYETMPYHDDYREAFANFSHAAVEHYDDLDYVEVWNEPNLDTFARGPAGTDPTAYAELLETTYPAVTDARENVTVLGGSATANYSGPGVETLDRSWWERFLAAGGAEHADALAVHLYRADPTGFEADVEELRNMTREHNDGEALPIWVTELGWHTSPYFPGGDREATQLRNLVRSHVRLRAAGVERLHWYTFQDSTWAEESTPQTDAGTRQFGLIRRHDNPKGAHTPKPGLVAYAVMTRHLAGTEFVAAESGLPEGVDSYLFENGSKPTRVLWADERTDVTVRAEEPVTVTSAMGGETRLVPRDGAVYLTVGPDPLYLEGSVANVTRGAPVSVEAPVASGAGDDITVGVAAGDESRTATHRIGGESATVTAAAGSTATATVRRPAAYRPRAATVVDVVSVDGAPVARLETPVGVPVAHFGDPSYITGMTVETENEGGSGYSEVNDVGTEFSAFEATARDGRACWETDVSAGSSGSRLAVDVADSHATGLGDTAAVTVSYYEQGSGELVAQYDGPRDSPNWGGTVDLSGPGAWRTHTFELPEPRLSNGLGGHDLRFVVRGDGADVCIGSIAVGPEAASETALGTDPMALAHGERTPDEQETDTPRDPTPTATAPSDEGPPRDDGSGEGGSATASASESGHGFGVGVALVGVAIAVVVRRRASRGR